MEEPKKRAQTSGLKNVRGTNVRNSRYYPNPTDSRPSDVAESAEDSERQFKMLPMEVPCEVLLDFQSMLKLRSYLSPVFIITILI